MRPSFVFAMTMLCIAAATASRPDSSADAAAVAQQPPSHTCTADPIDPKYPRRQLIVVTNVDDHGRIAKIFRFIASRNINFWMMGMSGNIGTASPRELHIDIDPTEIDSKQLCEELLKLDLDSTDFLRW